MVFDHLIGYGENYRLYHFCWQVLVGVINSFTSM